MKKIGTFLSLFGSMLVVDIVIYGIMTLFFINEPYKLLVLIGVNLILIGERIEKFYENNDNWKPDNEEEPFTNNKSRE